jgi:predicted dehydrogenase
MTINVAVIGCGCISSVHLDALLKIKGCNIHTVCDIDKNKAKNTAEKYNCKFTINYKDILNDMEIDAVHILTPHYLHTKMAIEANNAGKHVVLEKPIGIRIEELQEIANISEKSNAFIGVTFQNRYNPTIRKMKEIADSNILVNLIAAKGIVAWHRDNDYYNSSKWRGNLRMEGGGLLINQAIHTIDLLYYIGGNVSSLKGHVANHVHPTTEVEDTALITLYYENGAVGNFYGTINHGENSCIEIEFVYDNGTLRLYNNNLYLKRNDVQELIASDITKEGDKDYWGISHYDYIKEYYDFINNGIQPKISIKDALVANEIVLGAYESSKSNIQYKLEYKE